MGARDRRPVVNLLMWARVWTLMQHMTGCCEKCRWRVFSLTILGQSYEDILAYEGRVW